MEVGGRPLSERAFTRPSMDKGIHATLNRYRFRRRDTIAISISIWLESRRINRARATRATEAQCDKRPTNKEILNLQ